MIHLTNNADCCGCGACANICPHSAIRMDFDSLGFLYPKVDSTKCTDCGLCNRVCAFNESKETDVFKTPQAFAARHKNLLEIETSRSGGAFIAFSDWILSQNGVVYGAGYSDQFRVVHKRATTKQEVREFKGSKYVQSDITSIFSQIKEDLKREIPVLFSGTPCQTAAISSFIGKEKENLFLIDIICYGVPSPFIWRDYIKYQERVNHKKIIAVNFRDKTKYGWSSHVESLKFDDGTYLYSDIYSFSFYQHISFRPCCANCKYCNLKRPSDITLGDFWGWEKIDKTFNSDNKGCSLVLCNTSKGQFLFNNIKQDLRVIPAHMEDCMQDHLKKPSQLHPKYMQFEMDYVKYGFDYVKKKYFTKSAYIYIRRYLGRLKRWVIRKFKNR